MSDDKRARAFLLSRLVVGVTFLAAPGFASRNWLGEGNRLPLPGVRVAIGARDLVVSVGGLRAIQHRGQTGADAAPWLRAAAVCEAADAVLALTAPADLSWVRRVAVAAGAASLAATALSLAHQQSDESAGN